MSSASAAAEATAWWQRGKGHPGATCRSGIYNIHKVSNLPAFHFVTVTHHRTKPLFIFTTRFPLAAASVGAHYLIHHDA